MRRRTAQEPVEIDVLQKRKEELAQFVDRYNNAVSMVTGTVSTTRRKISLTPTSKSLALRHRLRSILAVVEIPVLTQNLRDLWTAEKLMTHSFRFKR